MSALVRLCVCALARTHIEMCKNVCVADDGVTGGSSSPQTRLDNEGAGQVGGRAVRVEQSPIWDMALGCI